MLTMMHLALLQVTLSADAELFVASCSALLTRDTMLKLGKDAICAVRGQESKQLVVLLQVMSSGSALNVL